MIKVEKLNPFGRMCVSLGMLPSSYKESLTYEEQLLWFCNYLTETVIPTVNNNAEAVEELQALYLQIKTYVDEYFDNLDVQEEINNKLDEMAESGELADVIAQYLGLAGMLTFNSVEDMKAAENLANGSSCETLGFYSVNDGGNAIYKIRTITNEDIVDEMTILSLYDETLIAELVTDTINIKQLGAYGDGTHDDLLPLQKAVEKYNNVYIPKGTYSTDTNSTVILIDKPITITGDGEDLTIIKNSGNGNIIDIKLETAEKRFVTIEKLTLDEDNEYGKCVEVLSASGYYLSQFRMNSVKTINGSIGFYLNGVTNDNLFLSSFEKCTFWNGFYASKLGDTIKITNCNFAFSGGIYIDQVNGASSLEFSNNNVTCTNGFKLKNAIAPLILNNIFEMTRDTENTNAYIELGVDLVNRQFEYNFISNTLSYASGYTTPNKGLMYVDKLSKTNILYNFIAVKNGTYSIILTSNSSTNRLDNTYGVYYGGADIAYAYQDNGTDNIHFGNFVNGSHTDGKVTRNSYDKYTGKKSITGSVQLINSNPIFAANTGYTSINYATYVDEYNSSGSKTVGCITTDGILPLNLLIGGLSNHCRIMLMGDTLPESNNERGDILINKYPREGYPYLFYFYNGSAWKGVGTLHDLT